jgi:hypothetical protein
MAVLAMEGFEHGDVTLLTDPVSLYDSNLSASYGRFGGKGCFMQSADSFRLYTKNGNYSTFTFGFAWKLVLDSNYNSTYSTTYSPIFFYSDTSYSSFLQFVNVNKIRFVTRTGSTTGDFVGDGFQMTLNNWYYFEIKVVQHATAGTVTMKVNGQTVVDETDLLTNYGGDYIDYIYIREIDNFYIDDIYVTDGEFLGDVKIRGFVPDANGTVNDFTPSSGSNYQCVDEVPSTDDTDYVDGSDPGDIDLYGITTGALSTVKAVKVLNQVKKTDAGTREARAICRSNGSNYNGTTVSLLDTYSNLCQHIWETDPDDSNAWNQTKLEAAEFGLEIVT